MLVYNESVDFYQYNVNNDNYLTLFQDSVLKTSTGNIRLNITKYKSGVYSINDEYHFVKPDSSYIFEIPF